MPMWFGKKKLASGPGASGRGLAGRYHFKHSNGRPHTILVKSRSPPFCPVVSLQSYLKYRGDSPGPLFTVSTGQPITRQQVVQALKRGLIFLGLSPILYKTHSFRIGAASYGVHQGLTDAQIRHLGRWKSDAFRAYIRLS